MGKVDIRTALSEGLTEKTDKARGGGRIFAGEAVRAV